MVAGQPAADVFAQAPAAPSIVRLIPLSEMPSTPAVAVAPTSITLAPGTTQRFTAIITGTINPKLTWTATGGTIAADGTYTAGVTNGAFKVTGTLTGGTVAASSTVTIAGAPGTTEYLSDRAWTSMTNGWGPAERDRSNGDNGSGDGAVLTLNGVTYAKGLGVHAGSDIRYPLNGSCTAFNAVVGVDDAAGTMGSVVFQVWVDGIKKYDSGVMTGDLPGKPVSMSLVGATELTLMVTNGGDNNVSDHGDWADARVTCETNMTYLSDRPWKSMTNGWGPAERDRSNGENGSGDGAVLTLNQVTYPKGLGVHANADIRYALNGACRAFAAVVGVDDESTAGGSIIFQVWSDGVKKFDSGVMTSAMAGKTVSVDITGANELSLVVTDAGDGQVADHGDWASARVSCSDTIAPTVTAMSPLAGATAVVVATSLGATFSEAMDPATITTATVVLTAQGSASPVSASVSYDVAAMTVTVRPAAALANNTLYTAAIKGGTSGAKDLAGNALAADRVWTFTTALPADTTPPTVAAMTPSNGASGVALATSVTATFSEAMNAASLTAATVTLAAQGSGSAMAATVSYDAASKMVTLRPAATLAGGTTYVATVKGGSAGASDVAGNRLAADLSWTFTSLAVETVSYLSDRAWSSMVNGWGSVERDRSNGENGTGDGAVLTLNGVTYAKGLGAHASSDVRFALNKACSTLSAVVGMDDESGANGTVVFQVWTDGVKRFDSGVMNGTTASKTVSVSLVGASELALILTDNGDGGAADHGDWADARVSCADTTAPAVSATSPAASATGVSITANAVATFSEAMNPATLTTSTVTLVAQGSTAGLAGTVAYDATAQTVTLDPTPSLAANTVYTVTVKGGASGAKDLAGNALAADKVWTFTTGGAVVMPSGTTIEPGEDIQAKVTAAANGTTFVLKAGVHRMQSITPKTGQTFVGEAGAILSGARVLTSFTRSGSAWVASGQTQQGTQIGDTTEVCRTTAVRCGFPEDLFINSAPLKHVASINEGGAGKWHFDYGNDKIYFWDDPTGKTVETSVTRVAFGGNATGVVLRSVVVEKYATPSFEAAINLGDGWILEDSEVRWNHSTGVWTNSRSISRRNKIHHNGTFGFMGAGDNILVENNEVSYNNWAGYNSYWGAGGSKWVFTKSLVVRGNFSHHNDGPGFWTDINNIYTVYENNTIEDNERGGIFHEISYDAIIRNNTLRRNGLDKAFTWWTTGAGIEVVSSRNVEVYGNVLEDNWQGITGLDDHRGNGNDGPWTLVNMNVHDNKVTSRLTTKGAGRTGVVDSSGTAAFSATANNRFRQNTYTLGVNAQYFIWTNGERTETEWRSFGHDTTGTFAR